MIVSVLEVQQNLDQLRTSHERELDELLTRVEAHRRLHLVPVAEPEANTTVQAMVVLEDQHQRDRARLQEAIGDLTKKIEHERRLRLEAERDSELSSALTAEGCIDPIAGQRYFSPMLVWDADSGWLMDTDHGHVSIRSGVAALMPNSGRPREQDEGNSKLVAKRKQPKTPRAGC